MSNKQDKDVFGNKLTCESVDVFGVSGGRPLPKGAFLTHEDLITVEVAKTLDEWVVCHDGKRIMGIVDIHLGGEADGNLVYATMKVLVNVI